MKKKELRKLRTLTVTPKMLEMVTADTLQGRTKGYIYSYNETKYQYEVYVRCQVFDSILKVAFFLPEHIKMGGKLPVYELYISKEESRFLTYDRLQDRWLTAKLDMLKWPRYMGSNPKVWISPKGEKLIKTYFETEHGGYRGLLEYQLNIRKEALKRRHKKETDPWDLDMAQIRELPKDWEQWVSKVGIAEHFIFYQYQRKGADTGYCTYCEKVVPIKNPRHNKTGTCPCCRHKITFKSEGKAGTVTTQNHSMFLLQRCEDGVVVRIFRGYRKYRRGKYQNPEQGCWEKKRIICSKEGIPLRTYYWGDYKHTEIRWIDSDSYHRPYAYYWYWNYDEGIKAGKVYGKTIPSLAKAELSHTGLPEFIKGVDVVNPEEYLDSLKSAPQLERLVKAGLPALTRDCLENPDAFKKILQNPKEGSLTKMLGIDTQRLKRLRENNGNETFLRWLQYEKNSSVILPDSVIAWYCAEKICEKDLQFISDRMSMVQIYNYIRRQMSENSMTSKEVLTTWSDYLSMAKRFKMDVNDAIVYRVRKLCQRHDELVQRSHQKEFALQAGEILQKYPHIEEIYESVKDIYEYAKEDYTVLAPSCIEDILLEGEALHHCVGSSDRYWERIERQESYVLFLRRTADKDKSYYTLEIEPDGTVRQKRTMYDRQEADIEDAMNFLKKWQKEVSKRISDKERSLAEKSRILRVEEFTQMRKDQVIINTGALRGQLLVDVLLADLMENKEETVEADLLEAA